MIQKILSCERSYIIIAVFLLVQHMSAFSVSTLVGHQKEHLGVENGAPNVRALP